MACLRQAADPSEFSGLLKAAEYFSVCATREFVLEVQVAGFGKRPFSANRSRAGSWSSSSDETVKRPSRCSPYYSGQYSRADVILIANRSLGLRLNLGLVTRYPRHFRYCTVVQVPSTHHGDPWWCDLFWDSSAITDYQIET